MSDFLYSAYLVSNKKISIKITQEYFKKNQQLLAILANYFKKILPTTYLLDENYIYN